jgi:hypothetical protein
MALIHRLALAARAAREHAAGRRASDLPPLRADDILEKTLGLDVSTWTYKFEPASVTRCGPMAQDFHRVYGFGASDKSIPIESAIGVLLVCVQVLGRRLHEAEERIGALDGRAPAHARADRKSTTP